MNRQTDGQAHLWLDKVYIIWITIYRSSSMQQTVCQWRRRLSVCVKAGGGHFEHYQSINQSLFILLSL